MMLLPSSLFISLFLLTSSSLAAPAPLPTDDGMWHAASTAVASVAVAATTSAVAAVATSAAPTRDVVGAVTTAATVAAVSSAAAAGSWETAVVWPAGCEKWANPCPAGAKISGGGIAGNTQTTVSAQGTASSIAYENGFTSYTTMTNSNGIITGMPAKATVAAGVTANTLVTAVRSSNVSTTAAAMSSKTQTGFSFGTTTASASKQTSGAQRTIAGSAFFLAFVAIVAALL